MSPPMFTMRLTVAGSGSTITAPAPALAPPSSRVQELLDEQRPQKMIDNMALIIIDQTYSALVEILGPDGAPRSGDGHGHVQVSRRVDPADPESPLLSVNASATHCCISLIDDSLHGGGGGGGGGGGPEDYSQYRLARATITASPGTLHMALIDGGGGRGDRDKYWACADVRPDVANKGLLGVLETVNARLDAAIRLEASLLSVAKNNPGCCRSPNIREVVEVRVALEKMRAAVDLDALMRRRRRRLLVQEDMDFCRPDVDQAAALLVQRLSALHVGQKRGCPVQETSCRLPPSEPDDAEVLLAKRLKTVHV